MVTIQRGRCASSSKRGKALCPRLNNDQHHAGLKLTVNTSFPAEVGRESSDDNYGATSDWA
jgi:hypothetical protein